MIFGFGKQAINADKWVEDRISDLLSERWNSWRADKYEELKKHTHNLPSFLNVEIFNNIFLGAQLKLFEVICVKSHQMIGTNDELGMQAVAKIDSYIMGTLANEWTIKSYNMCAQSGMSAAVRGIYVYDNCAMTIGTILDLDENVAFIKIIRADFLNFATQIGTQISQYKFV